MTMDKRLQTIVNDYNKAKETLEKNNINNTIVMFGSARIKQNKEDIVDPNNISFYYQKAYELANKIALWSKEKFENNPDEKFYVITGGGGGIMEAANKGAFDANERSVGLNIDLPFEQESNPYIPKELDIEFNHFFLRKFWLTYYTKAVVAFPGGYGTLDELFELLTLIQTNKIKKKVPVVMFGKEFFGKFMHHDYLVEKGLISDSDIGAYIITDDVDEAFYHITNNIISYKNLK